MNITITVNLGGAGLTVAGFVAESLKAFGHLVIWYLKDHAQPSVGQIETQAWGRELGQRFRLVRKATAAEAAAQLELYRGLTGRDVSGLTVRSLPYIFKPEAGPTIIDVTPVVEPCTKNPPRLGNAESTGRAVEKRRRKPPSQ